MDAIINIPSAGWTKDWKRELKAIWIVSSWMVYDATMPTTNHTKKTRTTKKSIVTMVDTIWDSDGRFVVVSLVVLLLLDDDDDVKEVDWRIS